MLLSVFLRANPVKPDVIPGRAPDASAALPLCLPHFVRGQRLPRLKDIVHVTDQTIAAPAATPSTTITFASLGLSEPLTKALAASGYTTPTPIQAQAIPPLLAGKDLLGLAETGTGKTAAFALPILQALAKITEPVAPRCCRALILAPTRELAIQIGDSFNTYGAQLKLRHTVVFGGVGSRPQIRAMDRGVDILIATPGRLLDLMGTRNVNLSKVQFLVLDEADRMLDMGFIRDVKRIVKEVPKVRQSLLFSATMPQDITSLANEILHHPVRVEIARAGKTVDRVEQFVYYVDTKSKRAALAALLKNDAMSRVILFTRTKHGADRVARGLAVSGVGAYAIHGNKSQNARQAALESFRSGKVRVLVATDIAARGIDIDDISHVVNYDIPNIPESYVHRIGRTARAGNSGVAIALCAPEERAFLRDIERLTRKPLTPGAAIPGLAEVTASLPPIPSKGPERDDDEAHFVRGRGRVTGRRHMPQTRPATAWRDTDPARPVEAGAGAPRQDRSRDDRGGSRTARPPHREDRGPSRDSERRGPPRSDAPRGDRPSGDRPRGDVNRGPAAPRSDRPFQARDSERRGPPRDGDRSRSEAPRGDARGRPPERRDGPPGRDFKRPERGADTRSSDRGNERSRDPVVSPSKPWDNRSPSNGAGRSASDGAPRQTRNDDRAPSGGRPEGRRPDTRGPDGRPPNRSNNSGDRPRGGDRPRPPARAGHKPE